MGISRAGVVAFGAVLTSVVVFGAMPLAAQEPPKRDPAAPAKSATAKEAFDPSRRVPAFFGQVGLTGPQKEEIYKIRGKRLEQIEALQKQISRLQSETIAECESVLNESQKQLLTLHRETSARARKAKAASAESPAAPKSAEKTTN